MNSAQVQQRQAHLNGKFDRRIRVLICACTSQEASEVFRSFEGVETVHISSSDIPEVGVELAEVRPDFVLCKADFLMSLMPSSRNKIRALRSEPHKAVQPDKAGVPIQNTDISPRDLEVLQLLAKGARNLDIAQALKLTTSSAKRILQRLYERFEAANRAELLGRAMELKLFPDSISNASSSKPR
jgi:DNA-binding CsgD family transcriptional regulator